jgi:hypothetical protein
MRYNILESFKSERIPGYNEVVLELIEEGKETNTIELAFPEGQVIEPSVQLWFDNYVIKLRELNGEIN